MVPLVLSAGMALASGCVMNRRLTPFRLIQLPVILSEAPSKRGGGVQRDVSEFQVPRPSTLGEGPKETKVT